MGIVTPTLRKMIKGLLVTKYIDQCGIKMPKVPNIPKFELPAMPDISMLEEQIEKIKSMASGVDNESIYTTEYIRALNEYQDNVDSITSWRESELKKLEQTYINEAVSDKDKILAELGLNAEYELEKGKIEATYVEVIDWAQSKLNKVTKFKRIAEKEKKKANVTAKKQTESKKNAVKSESLEIVKEMFMTAYGEWAKKESEKVKRLVEETKEAYNDTVELFESVKTEAKEYFQDGGAGDKFVEEECDKIDRIFDNFKEAFSELSTDVVTMVAKIPNPDVIVAGAATGIPNPAQKVMVFMENMKKVLTDIKKIINYIKEIIAIATAIGFAIKDLIPAFKQLCDAFEAKQKDADNAFKQAVKAIRKRQKWYLKHEHPKDEENKDETKLAGYMYADAKVDWVNHEINVKGFKCYCKKDYARKYTENGIIKKSLWIGDYHKNSGPYVDSAGKRYYYIPADEISGATEYNEQDIIDEIERDGEEYDIDLGTEYDSATDTTKLSLSDGRIVTIDYLAASGDVIRLDDGTVIRVK